MDSLGKVAEKLRSFPQIFAFFIPTEEELERFFQLEGTMSTSSGMPLINLSLDEAMKRKHHICIAQKEMIDPGIHHNMTMIDSDGKTIGFDVPEELEYEVEGRDDLVWLSEDFVLDPNASVGEVSMVLHPFPIEVIGNEEGACNAILMFPAAPTDDLMRDTYGLEHTKEYSFAMLSFDDL